MIQQTKQIENKELINDALLSVTIEDKTKSKLVKIDEGKYRVQGVFPYVIRRSLLRGENFVGIITGKTRSGKSFTALRIAMEIDPNFTIDNVVFSAQEFMELLHSGKLKQGSIIIWDEAGVGIATRDWYSILNKSINYVLQTWGHQSIGLLLTVPDFSFVDSQTRRLCNIYFKTLKLIRSRNVARLKAYYLSPMETSDTKKVRPRYTIGGKKLDIEYMEVQKPPTKLVNKYLKKKEEFTMKLNRDVLFDIQQLEKTKQKDLMKTITDEELLKKAWELLKGDIQVKSGKRRLNLYIIRKKLGITSARATHMQERLLEKARKEDYPSLETDPVFKDLEEEDTIKRLDPKEFM